MAILPNAIAVTGPQCRACGTALSVSFCDLGCTPLANAMVKPEDLAGGETYYPLHAWVCDSCFLVQLEEFRPPDAIFSDYLYFSSYSPSWLDHAKEYAEAMIARWGLGADSRVVEIASNDGYLLKNFVAAGIPCLGVDPARNVAAVAEAAGVPTRVAFFGAETARQLREEGVAADLMAANNVLAHVPRLADFVEGFAILLKPEGVITFEFPHLLRLIEETQFDTIYHEHFSYLSLTALEPLFARYGLRVFDVERLPTHGGSLRLFATHSSAGHEETRAVSRLREDEECAGLRGLDVYRGFQAKVARVKQGVMRFFLEASEAGKSVACYGAAAKGNTLLNYCGITRDLVSFAVDRSPHKQGHLMPGSHIPVRAPEAIPETRPDYIFILPWNLRDEIIDQLSEARSWGARFVIPIPEVTILE